MKPQTSNLNHESAQTTNHNPQTTNHKTLTRTTNHKPQTTNRNANSAEHKPHTTTHTSQTSTGRWPLERQPCLRKPVRHRVLQWVDHAAGLWFGVYGLGFMVWGLWFGVYGLGFMVHGLCFMVYGLWIMVLGSVNYGPPYSQPQTHQSPHRTPSTFLKLTVAVLVRLHA